MNSSSRTAFVPMLAATVLLLAACGPREHKVQSHAAEPPPPPKSIQEQYAPATDKAKATQGQILDAAEQQKKDIDEQTK
jgi:hypothetical protein